MDPMQRKCLCVGIYAHYSPELAQACNASSDGESNGTAVKREKFEKRESKLSHRVEQLVRDLNVPTTTSAALAP